MRRIDRRVALWAGWIATGLALGCSLGPQMAKPPAMSVDALEGHWTLVALEPADRALPRDLAGRVRIELGLTSSDGLGGRAAGFGGCNRFSGAFRAGPAGELSISPLATTRMAGPPDHMEFEDYFVESLQAAERFSVDREQLSIFAPERTLRFERLP